MPFLTLAHHVLQRDDALRDGGKRDNFVLRIFQVGLTMEMLRKLYFAFILFIIATPNFADENKIQDYLDHWRIEKKVPGVMVLIHTPTLDETYTSGTTQLDGDQPINLNTLFAVGSITKLFTSVMILKLEANGKLNINENIGKYFPQYPRWKNITIKQLLNMTSGIANFTENKDWIKNLDAGSKEKWTKNRIINSAYQQPDYFKPGKGWHYSNTGYVLLGDIIEQVTHQPLEKVFEAEFFKPLALKNTYYNEEYYPAAVLNNMAHGYQNGYDSVPALLARHLSNIGPPGGAMVMGALDLESWIDKLFIQQSVLPKKQLDELLTGVATPPNKLDLPHSKYGLGVGLSETKEFGKIISYAGTFPGYGSTFVWIPKKKILLIVQMNVNRQGNDESSYLHFPSQSLIQGILKIINY